MRIFLTGRHPGGWLCRWLTYEGNKHLTFLQTREEIKIRMSEKAVLPVYETALKFVPAYDSREIYEMLYPETEQEDETY